MTPLDLLVVLDDLESYAKTRVNIDPAALISVRDVRAALEKLILKMDNLEIGFDKIAERSRELEFH